MSILFGMLIAWGWAFRRLGTGAPLLPQTPLRPLPTAHWGAGTVLLVIVLYLGANLAVGFAHSALTGPRGAAGAGDHAEPGTAMESSEPGETPDKPKGRSPLEIVLLTCAANLAFCALAFPLLGRLSKIGPSHLGLFRDHWPRQVWFGVVAALLATPATYVVQFIAVSIWRVSEHPVQKMMAEQLTPGVAALAFLSTVILAPLVEETMFRGIFQRWLTRHFGSERRPVPPPVSPVSPPPAGDATAPFGEPPASETSIEPKAEPLVPDVSGSTAGDSGAPRAIVLTSILFAAMHGAQWPDPIALFVFSLVLGTVYQRTGSLLAAMVLHGAFNGCSTILALAQQLSSHLQELPAPAHGLASALNSVLQAVLEWMTTLG